MNEMKDIDFEQELYNHFGQVKDFTLGMRIGKYFYELGKQSGSSEIPNDLDEAAEKHSTDYDSTIWCVLESSNQKTIWKREHKETFIAGAKWQKEQDEKELSEKPVPADLEEAARKEYPCDKSWMTPDMLDLNAHKQVAFRKGAEWQKDKDTRDMYMSDNRHFEKVYQLGRTDMREQMLKKAVEGYVVKDITGSLAVTAKNVSLDGFKFGDKVRIIICKKEDKQLTSTPK